MVVRTKIFELIFRKKKYITLHYIYIYIINILFGKIYKNRFFFHFFYYFLNKNTIKKYIYIYIY